MERKRAVLTSKVCSEFSFLAMLQADMSLPITLDRFQAWVGVRQDRGDALIVQWQTTDGETEDIALSTILEGASAADPKLRLPARLLALYLLAEDLVPERLRINLQNKDDTMAVRSYPVALGMLTADEVAAAKSRAGVPASTEASKLSGLRPLKQLEMIFAVQAAAMQDEATYVIYDVKGPWQSSDWANAQWKRHLAHVLSHCGLDTPDGLPGGKQNSPGPGNEDTGLQRRRRQLKGAVASV